MLLRYQSDRERILLFSEGHNAVNHRVTFKKRYDPWSCKDDQRAVREGFPEGLKGREGHYHIADPVCSAYEYTVDP